MNLSKIDLRPIESMFKQLSRPLTKKKRVLIVRHGQSEGNVKPILYGNGDYPLTEIGKAQARLLSPIFKKYYHLFDTFASSNLTRAFDTYLECVSSVEDKSLFSNLQIKNNPNYGNNNENKKV